MLTAQESTRLAAMLREGVDSALTALVDVTVQLPAKSPLFDAFGAAALKERRAFRTEAVPLRDFRKRKMPRSRTVFIDGEQCELDDDQLERYARRMDVEVQQSNAASDVRTVLGITRPTLSAGPARLTFVSLHAARNAYAEALFERPLARRILSGEFGVDVPVVLALVDFLAQTLGPERVRSLCTRELFDHYKAQLAGGLLPNDMALACARPYTKLIAQPSYGLLASMLALRAGSLELAPYRRAGALMRLHLFAEENGIRLHDAALRALLFNVPVDTSLRCYGAELEQFVDDRVPAELAAICQIDDEVSRLAHRVRSTHVLDVRMLNSQRREQVYLPLHRQLTYQQAVTELCEELCAEQLSIEAAHVRLAAFDERTVVVHEAPDEYELPLRANLALFESRMPPLMRNRWVLVPRPQRGIVQLIAPRAVWDAVQSLQSHAFLTQTMLRGLQRSRHADQAQLVRSLLCGSSVTVVHEFANTLLSYMSSTAARLAATSVSGFKQDTCTLTLQHKADHIRCLPTLLLSLFAPMPPADDDDRPAPPPDAPAIAFARTFELAAASTMPSETLTVDEDGASFWRGLAAFPVSDGFEATVQTRVPHPYYWLSAALSVDSPDRYVHLSVVHALREFFLSRPLFSFSDTEKQFSVDAVVPLSADTYDNDYYLYWYCWSVVWTRFNSPYRHGDFVPLRPFTDECWRDTRRLAAVPLPGTAASAAPRMRGFDADVPLHVLWYQLCADDALPQRLRRAMFFWTVTGDDIHFPRRQFSEGPGEMCGAVNWNAYMTARRAFSPQRMGPSPAPGLGAMLAAPAVRDQLSAFFAYRATTKRIALWRQSSSQMFFSRGFRQLPEFTAESTAMLTMLVWLLRSGMFYTPPTQPMFPRSDDTQLSQVPGTDWQVPVDRGEWSWELDCQVPATRRPHRFNVFARSASGLLTTTHQLAAYRSFEEETAFVLSSLRTPGYIAYEPPADAQSTRMTTVQIGVDTVCLSDASLLPLLSSTDSPLSKISDPRLLAELARFSPAQVVSLTSLVSMQGPRAENNTELWRRALVEASTTIDAAAHLFSLDQEYYRVALRVANMVPRSVLNALRGQLLAWDRDLEKIFALGLYEGEL